MITIGLNEIDIGSGKYHRSMGIPSEQRVPVNVGDKVNPGTVTNGKHKAVKRSKKR